MLRIGNEFISYTGSTQVGNEVQVTGLARGQWSSTAAAVPAGATVVRDIMNGYGGAVGGLGILQDIANRLGTAWNGTGIMSNSFDGVESASDSGWGSYGMATLINGTIRTRRPRTATSPRPAG